MLNTSAITAVTKSSIKPQSGATKNRHLRDSGERNQEKRRTKVSFGRTMIRASQLQRLAKKAHLEMKSSEEIKPIALAVIELCMSEGISLIVSQSDTQSVSRKIC